MKHSFSQLNVLVVDDDGEMRGEICSALTGDGYQVAEAHHGSRALSLARNGPLPGLVLLDLLMPEKDGWQVLWELRNDERFRSLPVVVMSAVPKDELHGALVDGFLEKPFTREDLLRIVRFFLPRQGDTQSG
ncbi:MAG TPA: response regulator [Myxococcales bacterium]|nr:response regulator [Myxococcales bacterium]